MVVALLVQSSRVMEVHEDVDQILIRDRFLVVMHSHYLRVACFARADFLVCRVRLFSSRVAALYLLDSFESLENSLDAPETTSSNHCLA